MSVVGMGSKSAETPRKVGKGDGQLAHFLAGSTTITNCTGGSTGEWEGSFVGGVNSIISRVTGTWRGKRPLSEGVGEGMFLVWTPGTWGEPMFTSGHFFISATGVVGRCPKWPISGDTD